MLRYGLTVIIDIVHIITHGFTHLFGNSALRKN